MKSTSETKKSDFADSANRKNLSQPAEAGFLIPDVGFEPNVFQVRAGRLPVGNQTSQFFANVYLNPLDHFIIEKLKCEAYLRYADDFILLSNDKSDLHLMKVEIENFLKENLALKLHPLRQRVAPVSESASFPPPILTPQNWGRRFSAGGAH